jgi:hypothetical protein
MYQNTERTVIANVTQMFPFMGMYNRKIGPEMAEIHKMYFPFGTDDIEASIRTHGFLHIILGPPSHITWVKDYSQDRYTHVNPQNDRIIKRGCYVFVEKEVRVIKRISRWSGLYFTGNIVLRKTGLLPNKIEVMRGKRARGIERRTRWFYAKIIQRHWREARLNPYTQIGRNRINREYNELLGSEN